MILSRNIHLNITPFYVGEGIDRPITEQTNRPNCVSMILISVDFGLEIGLHIYLKLGLGGVTGVETNILLCNVTPVHPFNNLTKVRSRTHFMTQYGGQYLQGL